MNINVIESILNYLETARGAGHTTALIEDAPRTIVASNPKHVRQMARENKNVRVISSGDIHRLYGRSEPIVFDNQFVYELCHMVLKMERVVSESVKMANKAKGMQQLQPYFGGYDLYISQLRNQVEYLQSLVNEYDQKRIAELNNDSE